MHDAAADDTTADPDLAEQARSGHGVPSQDPNPAAQVPLRPGESEREAKSVWMGGGLMAGAAAGAGIGVVMAGPVGVLVGATAGAVVGALGGQLGGAAMVASGAAGEGASSTAGSFAVPTVHLHIEDHGGSGRPVVLIHGWPLSAEAWAPQTAVLQAAGYRVVAYDRRGFGRSDKPESSYSYDTLADDLQRVMLQCDLHDATLVGFSMGGGEVARYITRHGESRRRSVVFAAAVPPCLMQSADNPDGPLTALAAQEKKQTLEDDRTAFFDAFTRNFFSADGVLLVTKAQRLQAMVLCQQ